MAWLRSSCWACSLASASLWDVVRLDTTLFASGEALTQLVSSCGQYVAAGVGLAAAFWALGYVIWWVIDFARGVL